MAAAIDDLTDKEKEALRLLLAGHDAKSSARELNISVHTVNDRLRNARRKMGVSSSREAARILGDAEGIIPQSLAPASLGMETGSIRPDPADLNEMRRTGPSRMVWLAGGMLIMSIIIAAAVLGLVLGGDAAVSSQASETEFIAREAADDAESIVRAEAFLTLIDNGDWEESWALTDASFQSQVDASGWANMLEPVRGPLGEVLSRELLTVQRTSSLPGFRDGEYEVLQFETSFDGRSMAAVETLALAKTPQGWRVSGYFIR